MLCREVRAFCEHAGEILHLDRGDLGWEHTQSFFDRHIDFWGNIRETRRWGGTSSSIQGLRSQSQVWAERGRDFRGPEIGHGGERRRSRSRVRRGPGREESDKGGRQQYKYGYYRWETPSQCCPGRRGSGYMNAWEGATTCMYKQVFNNEEALEVLIDTQLRHG